MKKTVIAYIIFLCLPFTISAEEIKIKVLDAVKTNMPIYKAEVIIQAPNQSPYKALTDKNGEIILKDGFKSEDEDDISITISYSGYATIHVRWTNHDTTYSLSPILTKLDSYRIVLDWGDTPKDLDAHLLFNGQHLYAKGNKHTIDEASITKDITDGNKAETITINPVQSNTKYIYYVHNYEAYKNKKLNSEYNEIKVAKVYLYTGSSLVKTYTMPNGDGRIWIPFYIDENGNIVDRDIIIKDKGREYDEIEKIVLEKINLSSSQAITNEDKHTAIELNDKGKYYLSISDFYQAIYTFHRAINANPKNAEIYYNLGVSYFAIHKINEALWAFRKAVESAYGTENNNIQAESYYYIGHIFELENEYSKAYNNYKKAYKELPLQEYKQQMNKMRKKIK